MHRNELKIIINHSKCKYTDLPCWKTKVTRLFFKSFPKHLKKYIHKTLGHWKSECQSIEKDITGIY